MPDDMDVKQRKPAAKKSAAQPRQRMQSHLRNEQLLGCAIRVVARNGLGSSPHAATAKEAGVSVPTVFAYFPTRASLLAEVVADVDRFYEDIGKAVLYKGDALAAILEFLQACARTVVQDPDRMRIWLDWSTSVGQEDLWSLYLEFQRKSVKRLSAVIKRGQADGSIAPTISPNEAAMIIASGGHTVAQLMLTNTPLKAVMRYEEELVRAALHLPSRRELEQQRARKDARASAKAVKAKTTT
jgi:TetR/AcrR family hemagglutinin/protease transcriptional regulator